GSDRLGGATIQSRATEPQRRRSARCRAPASGAPRSIVRPFVHRLSASCDINVLLFTTHVNQTQTPLPTTDSALKLEVIFCVQGVITPPCGSLRSHGAGARLPGLPLSTTCRSSYG